MSKNIFTLNKNETVILIVGAGIHHAAGLKNERGRPYVKRLASWDGVQSGVFSGKDLGQTLAWELNALQRQDSVKIASLRLSEQQKELAKNLHNDSARARKFGWKPPLALQTLLTGGLVSDVISLNVDLVLESWLADQTGLSDPPRARSVVETMQKAKSGRIDGKGTKPIKSEANKSRHRVFDFDRKITNINFWYPHGDISKPSSLQFSLSDYAKSLQWMQNARSDFKVREKTGDTLPFRTWLDPFMSKNKILILGASIDPAEWDIWFALLCRWRNFAKHEDKDWYPTTQRLGFKYEDTKLPDGYIEKIQGETYDESWGLLQEVVQDNLRKNGFVV